MKLLVFLFFLVAASAVAAQYSAYDFAGNTTIADDPHHLLNYRYLDYSSEDDERLCFLRSLRSNMNADHDYDEIDTIGSLVSYTSFPSTFLAFWEGEAQWSNDSFDTSNAATAIASGLSTLIERNRNGAVVRSFSLSQATSNTSVGVYWDVFYGRNDDETLYWQELNTTISGTRPSGTFHFSISLINFASAIRGRIDVANMAITPRSIETAIKISDYQYLDATNTLSIRVFSAYGTNNYKVERGQISSGTAIDRVYFAIDETAQRLPNNTAISGTPLPVSISAWQILPGLRTPIAQSFTGNLLTDRYGASWDVLYSDITLPAPNSLDPQHSLLSLSMGNGATPSNATGPSAPGAPSSAPHLYPASCILLLALLLSLFL